MDKPFEPNLPKHKLVRVYRNLRRNCYSVVSVDTGRVIAHANRVQLWDCRFKVNTKGVEKIRATKRKRVVAWVQGHFLGWDGSQSQAQKAVKFDPYLYDTFVDGHGFRIDRSWHVDLDTRGWIWAAL